MGWFDEQIRQIKKKDQEEFEDSIFRMASVVLGKRDSGIAGDERIVTREAIGEILKYYHYKPAEIPDKIVDPEAQLEYCMRPHGIMRRNVHLAGNWYRDSFGPLLAFRKEDGLPVALLPGRVSGYQFRDPVTGRYCKVGKKTKDLFIGEAICFYRPLPQKALGPRDLLKFMKGCISVRDITLYLVLRVFATLVGMLMPYITRDLTGRVLESGRISFLVGSAVLMICVTISTLLIDSSKSLGMERIITKASISVEAATMARLMNLPAAFFREHSSGELSNRVEAVTELTDLLLRSVLDTGVTALISLLYLIQITGFAPALATPAILCVVLTLLVSVISSLVQIKYTRLAMESRAKSDGLAFALITGMQKIRLAGAEKRAFARWAKKYSETAGYTYDKPVLLIVNPAISLGITLATTIILYYRAVESGVSPADYLAFNAAFGVLMGSFGSLTSVAISVAGIKPILDMAKPILNTEPETSGNKEVLTSLSGRIELSNVFFRYKESSPYVVDGMDLKIRPGEYIALVGSTGCGKTTLLRLLLGFEKPERGAIYYDGRDMSKLDLKSLRSQIGVVTQDGSLFQGDIYSNIVISAPQLGLEEAWEAAEIAGIADDIREMPMGMNTMISEGQGGISGGQKQRLMIARAVAPKPKLLIFDEATSALDNKTQRKVSEALDALKCTRIVIAHRLSTIRHCDRILVLEHGRIMEEGTYEQLMEAKGMFSDLVARQLPDLSPKNA